jgi:hypothetical protein
MQYNWQSIFHLPEAALLPNKKIDKTLVVSQGNLSKSEAKLLNGVERLTAMAAVQKSTTKIERVIDEHYMVESVLFLECELRSTANYSKLAETLHKAFPNPTVICFTTNDNLGISAALLRKNLAEKDKMVVETEATSPMFNPASAQYDSFLDVLSFSRAKQETLVTFIAYYVSVIKLSQSIDTLGFYPICAPDKRQQLHDMINTYQSLSAEITHLNITKRELPIGKAANLRVKLSRIEAQRTELSTKIKEICNA